MIGVKGWTSSNGKQSDYKLSHRFACHWLYHRGQGESHPFKQLDFLSHWNFHLCCLLFLHTRRFESFCCNTRSTGSKMNNVIVARLCQSTDFSHGRIYESYLRENKYFTSPRALGGFPAHTIWTWQWANLHVNNIDWEKGHMFCMFTQLASFVGVLRLYDLEILHLVSLNVCWLCNETHLFPEAVGK